MPYITASIIIQLLQVVIPSLEKLRKEGEAGQKRITQYTRYLTVGARGRCSPSGYVFLFHNGSVHRRVEHPARPHGVAPSC